MQMQYLGSLVNLLRKHNVRLLESLLAPKSSSALFNLKEKYKDKIMKIIKIWVKIILQDIIFNTTFSTKYDQINI